MRSIRDTAFLAGNARNSHPAVTLVNVAYIDVAQFSVGEIPLKAPTGSGCGALVVADAGGDKAVADVGELWQRFGLVTD